ncbi:hypothetical protein ABZ490_11025 [Streptomyces sp. NPDC005811]|uniref:hypothetical protein n=1 Tax=Streptomyces sp. NPDC005811 TaxID=3154565 RepID=UPI0033C15344
MGIRTHHRRTALTPGTATADTQGDRDPAPPRRMLPARAPGASTARVPGTRGGTGAGPRLWAEQTRACLTLALAALGRPHRRKPTRRITVFVVTPPPLSARPDDSAPR